MSENISKQSAEGATQDIHESPDERMQRRRLRRWKRRARIVGPFLGIPILLVTLTLSIDLIEYQPQPQKERLTDRPMPAAVIEKQSARAIPSRPSLSSASVISSSHGAGSLVERSGSDEALDVTLGARDDLAGSRSGTSARDASAPAPPTPPYTLHGLR